MACREKHTKYQPEKLACPKCGIEPPDGLCVDDGPACGENACEKLHVDDYLRCYNKGCGYDTNGQAYANWAKKKEDQVECSHCKGRGFVKKEK